MIAARQPHDPLPTKANEQMEASFTTQYGYWSYTESKRTLNHGYLWPAVIRELYGSTCNGGRVLDAGCGSGALGKVLNEQLGYDVCGCDLSESGIALAREHAPGCRFERHSVYDDFVAAFGGSFDTVISIEVIEHLYDPEAFVSRVRDALTPAGTFILTTPYHGYLKNLLIAATGRCDAHYSPLMKGGHIKFWSPRTLHGLLASAGFRVERIYGVGRAAWLWKSMVAVARKA